MIDKFSEREKGFEKEFARDEELQFKVQARNPNIENDCNYHMCESL